MRTRIPECCCALALAALLLNGTAAAAGKPDPTGPPPDLTQGGKLEWTDFAYHLGPTGAQGQMYVKNFMTDEARQILITTIDKDSPADGVLEVGDVILGIDGERFDKDARKSLGWAIDAAEREENKGVLKLLRWRGGKVETVSLQLRVMGAFSDTAPYDCPKTKKILEDAMEVLVERKDGGRFEQRALAYLATGEAKYVGRVRDTLHAAKWAGPDVKIGLESGGLVCWSVGYQGVLLTEYYLATGDEYVLPAIREHAVKAAMGQSQAGTWGHGFAWTQYNDGQIHGRLGGYGALNQAGLPCFLTLILAKKCGIEHAEIDGAIAKASRFFTKFVGHGSIGYGFHRPSLEIHANGRNGMSGNGKNGIAAVAFSALGRPGQTRFFAKLTASLYNSCEYGHSGNSYSYFWDPLGANCGGPETVAAFLKELRWYYALTRKPDGSFVYQPLAGYYGRGLLDPTVAQVLIATLPRKAIHLTGKGRDKKFWLGKKGAEEAAAAGRWRLADTDKMSAKALIAELDGWSPIARERVAMALGKKDGNVVPQLVALLKSDRPEARAGACAALGYQGERAAKAIPPIAKALTDNEAIVRVAASYALARIDKPARGALADMLRAILVDEEDGEMRPVQQAMAYALGYAAGRYAPLYFDGILPRYAEGEDPLEGVDRELLYGAVRKLMASSSGRVRGCGVYVLRFFTKEDTAAMAQPIVDIIRTAAPNYVMFDDLPRQYGLDLLARHRIEEGLDLCFETLEDRWGKGVRFQNRCRTLQTYAGNAKAYLPRVKEMRWTTKSLEDRQLLEDTIKAIEEDKNPKTMVSLHTLVDQRLAKDLRSAKDKAERVRLCRELMKKHADDTFYQAAGLRQLVALLGAAASDDVPAVRIELRAPVVAEKRVTLEEEAARAVGGDAEAAKAAMDALSASPDPKATDVLMALADDDANPRVKGAAITACLRRVIIGRVPAEKKMEFLKKLLALDERGRNAKTVLAELPWAPSIDSLRLAQSCLSRKGLAEPSAAAVVAIAERMDLADPKQRAAAVGALREALTVTKNEDTTKRAKALIAKQGG